MPAKEDSEIFRLKVTEIINSVLKERDLTVKEASKIKEAIQASLELILSQHDIKNRSEFEKIAAEIVDKRISDLRLKQAREKESDQLIQHKKTYRMIAISLAIFGATIGAIQIILKMFGIM